MPVLSTARRRAGGIVAILAILVVAAVAGPELLGADDSEASDAAGTGPVAEAPASDGRPLPVAPFELLAGGSTSFAAFEGKPLVINFFASWCPACIAELPEFRSVHEARGDEVTFLGIANADQRDAARALADRVGLSYRLGDDPGGDLFRELGLFAMPSTVFVTADGRVHEVFGGQLDEAGLVTRVDQLVEVS